MSQRKGEEGMEMKDGRKESNITEVHLTQPQYIIKFPFSEFLPELQILIIRIKKINIS